MFAGCVQLIGPFWPHFTGLTSQVTVGEPRDLMLYCELFNSDFNFLVNYGKVHKFKEYFQILEQWKETTKHERNICYQQIIRLMWADNN